ncbi:MAG: 8-oxoguanine deaminase [Rhodocyclaceae bacterium]|nr:8-oxoguanine deaminase [Rhodocyclaceae bacterium]MBX3668414.1 8-oxoguanine deaminase [Rhodocyclaceae bacterium]
MTDTTLLLKNARLLATFDDDGREIAGGGVFVRGQWIEQVGRSEELPHSADEVIDLAGQVLLPGLINTHHHMFQTLTRAVPAGQDAELFGWLKAHFGLWSRLTPDMLQASTRVAVAELLLSGCTTSSDHLYVFPNGCRLEHTIEPALQLGLRFHPTRGAISLGESQGGLPPDDLVEREGAILADMRRVIEAFHEPEPGAMVRIGVAPCSPFSVTPDLMREAAHLARAYGVRMHTHLAESDNDVAYLRERHAMTPVQYAETLDWIGSDVWHAHCVKLDAPGIAAFAASGTGVAHCPSSNLRLGSGIAPIAQMCACGVKVGLGVDGSASNDAGHLLAEARQAMLVARAGGDTQSLGARKVLELATRGGAAVLGRPELGQIAPGKAADLVAFDLSDVAFAGALQDPLAALVFCTPARASWSIVDGRVVVREGQLVAADLPELCERHNRLAASLFDAPA